MNFKVITLAAIVAFTVSSCSKNRTDLEVCTEGKWTYHSQEQDLDAFLEIDDDNNAKYYVPNANNLPACTGNLIAASFKLEYIPNTSQAVVKGLTKNNCYSSNFSFVDNNETILLTCSATSLYISRADTTIYALTKVN